VGLPRADSPLQFVDLRGHKTLELVPLDHTVLLEVSGPKRRHQLLLVYNDSEAPQDLFELLLVDGA
jgi:hypothetical protein